MAYIEYVNQRERPVLNFGIGNGKLANDTLIFNLPAGYTCPGASLCLSKAVRGENGKSKIVDGPKTEFRCFAASSEALFPVVYNSRHSNWAAIKAAIKHGNLADVLYCDIKDSMTKKVAKVRVHESGDFYSESYLKGWLEVCKQFPTLKFYAYSKNLPLFVNGNFLITSI